MIGKPNLDKIKERANLLYIHLKDGILRTKPELCNILGWEYNTSNDRRIREIISMLAKKVPIISTSDNKGYRMAKNICDLEEVEHQWKELDSRIQELEERKKPLIDFYEKARVYDENKRT